MKTMKTTKTLMTLGLLLAASSAFACPDLRLNYRCLALTQSGGYVNVNLEMSQKTMGVFRKYTQYSYVFRGTDYGSPIMGEGGFLAAEGEGKRGSSKAKGMHWEGVCTADGKVRFKLWATAGEHKGREQIKVADSESFVSTDNTLSEKLLDCVRL